MQKGYTILKLPEYENEIPKDGSDICRLFKTKGELTFISKDPINYLAYVTFPKGGIPRGNHYHEKKLEFFYLAKGKIKFYVRPANNTAEEVEEIIVEEGSIIRIEPLWSHAFVAIEEGYAVEYSPMTYEIGAHDHIRDIIIS